MCVCVVCRSNCSAIVMYRYIHLRYKAKDIDSMHAVEKRRQHVRSVYGALWSCQEAIPDHPLSVPILPFVGVTGRTNARR